MPRSVIHLFQVFVRGQSADSGFTDPSKERQDSVKDLIKTIRDDSKTMRIAESEDDALLTMEILDRETSRSWRPFMGMQNRSVVAVRLMARDFNATFTGDGGDSSAFTGYRKAASKIVKQMDEWVKTNRARILAVKSAAPIETFIPPKP